MIDRKYHTQLIASMTAIVRDLKREGFTKVCTAMTDTGWDNTASWIHSDGRKARLFIDRASVTWQRA